MKVKVKMYTTISEVEFTQEKLNLTDEEMQNTEALKQYIQEYYVPTQFTVESIEIIK